MIDGRWFITPHAIRRYRERHRVDISDAQALRELTVWSEVATYSGPTRDGQEEWRSPSWFPRVIRFVVAPTPRSEGDRPQLVTVLPGARVGWFALDYDLETMFSSLHRRVDPWADGMVLDREWLASRRAAYAIERRENTIEYRGKLARARSDTKRRLSDPVARADYNRRQREGHRIARAERVAGRRCKECSGPVTPRRGIGPTPVFCSQKCSHRAASRAWCQRKRAKKT